MSKGIVACVLLTALLLIPVTFVSALPITSVTTIDGNTISVTYISSNIPITIDPSTPDYDVEQTSIQGYDAVRISNNDNANGGIADSDGNVDVILSIPEDTPFVIRIGNRESYNVVTHVVIANVLIDGESGSHTYNRNLSAGFNTYLCHYIDKYGTHQWHRSNLSTVANNDGWYQSSNGQVDISISAHYDDGTGRTAQNVYLDVILKND